MGGSRLASLAPRALSLRGQWWSYELLLITGADRHQGLPVEELLAGWRQADRAGRLAARPTTDRPTLTRPVSQPTNELTDCLLGKSGGGGLQAEN
jgi:hypothetical protein